MRSSFRGVGIGVRRGISRGVADFASCTPPCASASPCKRELSAFRISAAESLGGGSTGGLVRHATAWGMVCTTGVRAAPGARCGIGCGDDTFSTAGLYLGGGRAPGGGPRLPHNQVPFRNSLPAKFPSPRVVGIRDCNGTQPRLPLKSLFLSIVFLTTVSFRSSCASKFPVQKFPPSKYSHHATVRSLNCALVVRFNIHKCSATQTTIARCSSRGKRLDAEASRSRSGRV